MRSSSTRIWGLQLGAVGSQASRFLRCPGCHKSCILTFPFAMTRTLMPIMTRTLDVVVSEVLLLMAGLLREAMVQSTESSAGCAYQ